MKKVLGATVVLFFVVSLLSIAFSLSGLLDNFLRFWLMLFTTGAVIIAGEYLFREYNHSIGRLVSLVAGAIFVLLLAGTVTIGYWPLIHQHFASNWPFSTTAAANRHAQADIDSHDATNPVGTDLQIAAANWRAEQERLITKGAEHDYQKAYDAYKGKKKDGQGNLLVPQPDKDDLPKLQQELAKILRTKEQNLKYMDQELRVRFKQPEAKPDPPEENVTLWDRIRSFDPDDVRLSRAAIVSFTIVGIVVIALLPKKKEEKTDKKETKTTEKTTTTTSIAPVATSATEERRVERRRS
ncbi:MAG: hypothetical protein ACM3NH_03480 [Candidatus Saccharibacteria bacterium]